MTDAPLWTPDDTQIRSTNLYRFMTDVAAENGLDLPADPVEAYAVFHEWSWAEPARFWAAAWDALGVIGDRGDRLVEEADRFRDVRYLPDATLNVAENLIGEPTEALAMMFRGEDGEAVDVTRAELHDMVARIQVRLRAAGVGVGDRVVAWLPNRPETYAVMLAAAGLGATFASTSPDFGVDGVIDRFGQIEPTVLFAVPHYAYNGKRHDCLERLEEIRAGLPTVRTCWWSSRAGSTASNPNRSRSNPCPSIIRGTCCSRRAPPGNPSASSTVLVVCCSSTSSSRSCTATSDPVTACSTSPLQAG